MPPEPKLIKNIYLVIEVKTRDINVELLIFRKSYKKIVRHFVGNWHCVTWLLSPLSLFVTTEVVKKNYHKTFAIKRSFSGASSSVNFSGHTAITMVKQKILTLLSILTHVSSLLRLSYTANIFITQNIVLH